MTPAPKSRRGLKILLGCGGVFVLSLGGLIAIPLLFPGPHRGG